VARHATEPNGAPVDAFHRRSLLRSLELALTLSEQPGDQDEILEALGVAAPFSA